MVKRACGDGGGDVVVGAMAVVWVVALAAFPEAVERVEVRVEVMVAGMEWAVATHPLPGVNVVVGAASRIIEPA